MSLEFNILWAVFLMVVLVFILSKILEELYTTVDEWTDNLYGGMVDIEEVYRIQEEIESLDSVDRVMFYHNHNGGEKLSPKSPMRVTPLWGNSPYIDDLKQSQVDYEYVKVLIEAKDKGSYDYTVKNEKDSFLKKLYQRENIEYSKIFYISDKHKKPNLIQKTLNLKGKVVGIFFLSIATKEGTISLNDRIKIDECIQKLKTMYQ